MQLGHDFREEHVLDDGTPVVLRPIGPADAPALKRGFARLSPTSRYHRFLGVPATLSDEALRYLTCVDGRDHVAIVATGQDPASGAEIGLGVARFIRTREDPAVAEAALTVVDDMQRKGLGRILAIAIARAALERGVKRFRGEVLTDNQAVRQLLEDVGAVVVPSAGGSLVFDVELAPAPSTSGLPLEVVARRVLRAASSRLAGLIRGLGARSPR